MRPKTVLEVGIGNGFVSSYLRLSGMKIYTADINEKLEPDICAPIAALPELFKSLQSKPDLVVCCEVLEHLPFDEFEKSIQELAQCGRNLYMTLPNYKVPFGVGGIIRIAPLLNQYFGFWGRISIKRPINSNHFWEIASTDQCQLKAIKKILLKYFKQIKIGDYSIEPYHSYFVCSTSLLCD